MSLLVVLSLIALVAAYMTATSWSSAGRAHVVLVTCLLWNAQVIACVYFLGYLGILTRRSLGVASLTLSAAILVTNYRLRESDFVERAARYTVHILRLPIDALLVTVRSRSLLLVGFIAATLLLLWTGLMAYFTPTWKDWDCLWYHEPITAFAIQNHGFQIVSLPASLQNINGFERVCETTQLWFAIFGGRAVIDMPNVLSMPLLMVSVYLICRRFMRDQATPIGFAAALVLMPATSRLLQSTMNDPQAAALLVAAAALVSHPELSTRNALVAVVALTLAIGAKALSILPVLALCSILACRVAFGQNGLGATTRASLIWLTAAAVGGMLALTRVRNYLHFHAFFWPAVQARSDGAAASWGTTLERILPPTTLHGFTQALTSGLKEILGRPFAWRPDQHHWQADDWGPGIAWMILPIGFVAAIAAIVHPLARAAARFSRDLPAERAGAWSLAVPALLGLYVMSDSIYIGRYFIGIVGMLMACIAWASRWLRPRVVHGIVVVGQLGSIMLAVWATPAWLLSPSELWAEILLPSEEREIESRAHISRGDRSAWSFTAEPRIARLRERELGPGSVVVFDRINYVALLWNNHYSNRVVWLDSQTDPLAQARAVGAAWIYTEPGTLLARQLEDPSSGFEVIGSLDAENRGTVYRSSTR